MASSNDERGLVIKLVEGTSQLDLVFLHGECKNNDLEFTTRQSAATHPSLSVPAPLLGAAH